MLWMATILLLLSMAGKVQSRRVDEQFCWGVSYWCSLLLSTTNMSTLYAAGCGKQ